MGKSNVEVKKLGRRWRRRNKVASVGVIKKQQKPKGGGDHGRKNQVGGGDRTNSLVIVEMNN